MICLQNTNKTTSSNDIHRSHWSIVHASWPMMMITMPLSLHVWWCLLLYSLNTITPLPQNWFSQHVCHVRFGVQRLWHRASMGHAGELKGAGFFVPADVTSQGGFFFFFFKCLHVCWGSGQRACRWGGQMFGQLFSLLPGFLLCIMSCNWAHSKATIPLMRWRMFAKYYRLCIYF